MAQPITSFETLLRTAGSLIQAEPTFDYFKDNVSFAQAGFFHEAKVPQPNLVLSPASKSHKPSPRLCTKRDDIYVVTYYAYARHFGLESGLFGDTTMKGITEIGDDLEEFLIDNRINDLAIPEWIQTEYPTFYNRNFELLGEVRVTFQYRLRGN